MAITQVLKATHGADDAVKANFESALSFYIFMSKVLLLQ
jgi:hypothetical protein